MLSIPQVQWMASSQSPPLWPNLTQPKSWQRQATAMGVPHCSSVNHQHNPMTSVLFLTPLGRGGNEGMGRLKTCLNSQRQNLRSSKPYTHHLLATPPHQSIATTEEEKAMPAWCVVNIRPYSEYLLANAQDLPKIWFCGFFVVVRFLRQGFMM